jgi:hypothetical protein
MIGTLDLDKAQFADLKDQLRLITDRVAAPRVPAAPEPAA